MFNEFWCKPKVDLLVQYLELLKSISAPLTFECPGKTSYGAKAPFWDTRYFRSGNDNTMTYFEKDAIVRKMNGQSEHLIVKQRLKKI